MRRLKHFFQPYPIDTPALTVRGIGLQEVMPPCMIDRARGTVDHLIMYFYQETWASGSDGHRLRPAGSLVVWPPGQAHRYGVRADRPWSHSWVHCDGTLVRRTLKRAGVPVNQVVTLSDPGVVERWLEELLDETAGAYPVEPILVMNIMENGLLRLGRALHDRPAASPPAVLLDIREHLERHFTQTVRLSDLARRAHLCIPHFCAQFKRYFHTSAIDHVIHLRMRRAIDLLHDPSLRVADVAKAVGYDDVYHFSKLFKRRYGVSPLHLRRSLTGGAANEPR
jgi:AraC-like DNA-binding protein